MQTVKRLLVVGSLNYDVILEQKRLPRKGETYQVDRVTMGGGGKGANQAVQAAKMGVATSMIGAVGQDLYGENIERQLRDFGVDTRYIKKTNEPTGLGVNNVLPDGSVFGNIVCGANYALTKADLNRHESEFSQSAMALFQMEIPTEVTEHGISLAKKHGCYVIFNAAPALPISDSALALVDCFIVNESEASYYAGQSITTIEEAKEYCGLLYSRIGGLVVITLGEQGSLLYNGSKKVYIPARRVQAVDTTGAGDSYVGVLAAKLLEGAGLIQGAVWATLASSITVTNPGTQVAMPVADQIEQLFEQQTIKPVYID